MACKEQKDISVYRDQLDLRDLKGNTERQDLLDQKASMAKKVALENLDLQEEKVSEEKLVHMAYSDPLAQEARKEKRDQSDPEAQLELMVLKVKQA